jgi:hypothetical protein
MSTLVGLGMSVRQRQLIVSVLEEEYTDWFSFRGGIYGLFQF